MRALGWRVKRQPKASNFGNRLTVFASNGQIWEFFLQPQTGSIRLRLNNARIVTDSLDCHNQQCRCRAQVLA